MTKQNRKYIFVILPKVDKELLHAFRENRDKIYFSKVVPCDDMRLEIGYGLIPLVEKNLEHNLLERIGDIRRRIIEEFGFQIPTIRIVDNLELDEMNIDSI